VSSGVLGNDDVARLVKRANDGDASAWDEIVEQFAGLVWSVVRAHGLFDADAHDVFQTVWLRCVEHLRRLRDPERLAGWLATTTRHECFRVTRMARRAQPMAEVPADADEAAGEDRLVERLSVVDEQTAFRRALGLLPEQCRVLLRLLLADPPLSYDEISDALGIPRGSIGPTRQRCLDRVRRLVADSP
jgi:RNA polymerase sigma factor (sigma-70 family)